jgi:ABC-type phosphate transport system substrate-binding protein
MGTKLIGIMILAAMAGQASDFIVVANPSVKANEISGEDLKRVFLGAKTSLADGSAVEPVLAAGGATHEAFLKTFLGKTDPALRNHFKSLVFTGKGSMPRTLASDGEIVSYVAKTKGAVGYVGAGTAAAGVKKLEVK